MKNTNKNITGKKNNPKKSKATKKVCKEIIVAALRKNKDPLYTFSSFSGVGGLDKGARLAGFQSLFQSDYWLEAGRAFELNIPVPGDESHPEYLHSEGLFFAGKEFGDIAKLSFEKKEGYHSIQEYLETHLKVKIKKGEVSVIHGGPPCQDFSNCNQHQDVDGEKNQLIFELLRLIDETKPKVGLIEQVPNILSEKFKHIWARVKLTLNRMTDYWWDCKIINAKHHGARQDRERLIIMLVRKDLNVRPSFPIETEPDMCKVAVQSLLPHVYSFSPGQFADGIKSAKDNVFCTMTATGSEYFYGLDGKRRKPKMAERLVLTELEGLKLTGIPETSQKTLVGNMVQISLAEALFNHIKTHILKVPPEKVK